MNCPWCNSEFVYQSTQFDMTDVSADVCVHDFECGDCGGWFTIQYHATETCKVSQDGWTKPERLND